MNPEGEAVDPQRAVRLRTRLWAGIKAFLASLTLTTLFSGAFVGMMFSALNRQAFLWGRQDTLELFLLLALLALAGWGGFAALDRLSRGAARRFGCHLIYFFLAVAALQLLPEKLLRVQGHWLTLPVLAAGGLLSAASLLARAEASAARVWRIAAPFACLYPLLLANLLAAVPLNQDGDLPAVTRPAGDPQRPPVFIVFFDGLSKDICSTAAGDWRADLVNLDSFRKTSLDFARATASGWRTTDSIPNFLFQRDPAVFNRIDWADDFLDCKPASFTNGVLFHAAKEGYRRMLVGSYLPYRQLFGPFLDHAYVMSLVRFADSDSLCQRLLNQLASIWVYARGPLDGTWYRGIPIIRWVPGRLTESYYCRAVHRSIGVVRDQLAHSFGPQDLLFAHISIPHNPTIFLEDGTVDTVRSTYWTQVQYTDRVLGGILDVMRRAGVFDSSWILVSADHGSLPPKDPNPRQRHVPLLIKPPNGRFVPQRIESPVNMWEMGPFFQAMFAGQSVDACLALLAPDARRPAGDTGP